ncbi:o-succinylbenzoate--CoA ligase [Natronocalculus amylovorans]|uniref:O-succinylbenzoate--CoA ligase n=1 Tax=Natronocalculus amylovorans TaxID=2917812 RepID=A0AAE3FX09_9EURY|nr:o-succinylbenzoate--CoA ligase [Natronocalculus amylovorans]MCL9816923.1 o-succinylbenzoate--CoA ligase [Natronocalculus amylovorans]
MRDWLTHRARATPDATAIVSADDDETWSYEALDRAVEEAAGRLCALGIQQTDTVALLLPTTVTAVGLFHAGMRLGLTIVPLSNRLTPRELADRIERSDSALVVCSAETEQVAVEAAGETPVATVDEPQWEGVASIPETEPAEIEPYEWERSDPQLLLSTSGTTGKPKLVTLTMGNLLASAVASGFKLGIDPADRWLVTLSLAHMGGIAPLFRSTLYGTTVVLRSEFEAGRTADDIDRHGVTIVSLVPTMLLSMLDSRGTLSDSLRVVLLGGAPASTALIDRCRNYSVPVFPTYGMTETASQIATARQSEAFERPDTVGRPLLWTDVTIVDSDDEPVSPGEQGEIIVGGPTVTPGYYQDQERTSEAFCEYGLRTGDIGYEDDDGYLYILNRVDDRINTGGENVDPGEVVEVLLSHPTITDAAVVGIPDETWNERVAALVCRSDESVSADDIDAFCRERLAGFKLPRFLTFTDEIPRTVSGTIDRSTVREQLLSFAKSIREAHQIPDAESDDVLVPDELVSDDIATAEETKNSEAHTPESQTEETTTEPTEPQSNESDTDESVQE